MATVSSTSTIILSSLVVYKLMLIGIGFWASRRVRSQADFLLGGRQLGAWVAGLSYAASTSSAWALLGFSGFVFVYGVSALWMLPGIWGGYVVLWIWFGPKVRAESSANNWVTPTDFFCGGLPANAKEIIAALSALLITFCFVFYIAAQFDAAATAFVANFNIGKTESLLLGAAIILAYCLLGGFWAASVTDTLQSVVMVLVATVVPVLAVTQAGGYSEIFSALDRLEATGAITPTYVDWTGGHTGFILLGFLFGLAGIGVGTLGQPHLLARLMAVKGDRERKQGFVIAITWAIAVYIGMSSLGLAARSMAMEPGSGEQVFYLLAEQLLPPVLAGIVIAAILSAVMSTVDSLLLAASAAVSHDLGLSRRLNADDLLVSRIVMSCIVAGSVVLALVIPDTIFNRVLFAWSALGAAFGPLVLVRIIGIEPPAKARFWSIVTGFSLTVLFYSYGTISPEATTNALANLLAVLGNLPGDPFERLIPFIPPLLMLVLWPNSNPGRPVQ